MAGNDFVQLSFVSSPVYLVGLWVFCIFPGWLEEDRIWEYFSAG